MDARSLTTALILVAAAFWLDEAGAAEPAAAPAGRPCTVTIHADHKITDISPLFFGINTLYQIDDKKTLADEHFIQLLKDVPVRLIRFPGGDVADNYLWDERKVEDPDHYPNKVSADAADTDSFIPFCRKVGAEPMFVINLETGFVNRDNERSAKLAADWVKYCKEKNYNVRRWEIGNETYLYNPGKHKRLRVTPAQYAEAFVKVVTAMKAVDPTIQCGAVGPQSPTKSANNKMADGSEMNPPLPVWWPTVIANAGPMIDFVIVHEYPGRAGLTYDKFVHDGAPGGTDFPALRKFLDSKLGRRVPMALTEWNVAPDLPMKGMATAQVRATMIGHYLTEGIDMANIWPLRTGGKESIERGVLNMNTLKPNAAYDVLQLYSKNVGKSVVESSASEKTLSNFATVSEDGKAVTVFLVCRSAENQPRAITLDIGSFKASKATGEALTAPSLDTTQLTHVPLTASGQDGKWECTLPPFSIGMLRLE